MIDPVVWAEIDLECIRENVRSLKSLLTPATSLCAVVKADGYGHGASKVAGAAIQGGADWLGVARVGEGKILRDEGIDVPILLLAEPPIPQIQDAISASLTISVYSEGFVEALIESPGNKSVHIKLDTGMHRYGAAPETLLRLFDKLNDANEVSVEGMWSHFAVAEDVLNPFTKRQFERFMDVVDELGVRASGLTKHIANSAATITLPSAHLDMVRCGIAVYGIHPSSELADRVALKPALSLKTKVGFVKRLPAGEPLSYGQRYTTESETSVATIPCGYADGVTRAMTNVGDVLIRGRRYRISGTVTMDHILVAVGDDDVQPEDEVVIIGEQGSDVIAASDVARTLETIPYEVVCLVGSLVPRIYKN